MLSKKSWPVAILDVGSNSVKLVVFAPDGGKPLFSEKVLCRLGRSLNKTGKLDVEGKLRTALAIEGFTSIARAFNAPIYRILATAALREAKDGKAFVRGLEKKLKVKVRILSGFEEAYFAALGVLAQDKTRVGVVIDLGGGSFELAHVDGGKVKECASFPFGTLRFASKTNKQVEKEVETLLKSLPNAFISAGPLYASGGTARAIHSAASKLQPKRRKNDPARVDHLKKLAKKLAKMTPEQIARDFDVDPVRATVLPEACHLLSAVMTRLESHSLVITSASLREGYLYALQSGQEK